LSASQLITQLRSLGFTIAASGGRLRVTAERGELTDQIRQMIVQQKAELLDLLTHEAPADSADLVTITRDGPLPLSSFQERLWILHRLDPDNTTANMVTAWPHGRETDAVALQGVIRSVLQANEILRVRFHDDGTAASAHALPAAAVPVAIHDLRGLTEPDQQAAIRAGITAETHTAFDLTREAPTRWTLYQLAARRFAVMLAAHHIVMDEWSLTLLRRQIEAPSPASRTTALQYADYAAWQRRARSRGAIERDLAWWETQLAGVPQLCSFPADRTNPTGAGVTGDTRQFHLGADLVSGLHGLIRREGVTVYMALLAAFAAVLRVHTGQDDIVLGSSTGMRERPEFEQMVGPFVNLLVLRLKLENDPSFVELLGHARDVLLDALEHRQVPFEMLVDRLRPPRSFDRPPLFFGGGAALDLTWFAKEVEGRIQGSFEYRADLYDAATIDRIARHLEVFLGEAVRDPTRPLSRISLLAEAERAQVLTTFNATGLATDRSNAHRQFERQAAAHPDRLALTFADERLTYDALNRRANRMARLLQARGAAVGTLVGVCLERSPDLVAALLAVQKSGAGSVPIDPHFPLERQRFMVADSGLTAVIATSETATRLALPAGVMVIDPAAAAARPAAQDDADLAAAADADDTAYLIYTSGSTGTPNGVRVSHGALANFLGAMRHAPGLGDGDVLAAITTVSFDIAALELYLPLTVGARIVLVATETTTDGAALARQLTDAGATVLQGTPATWRLLVEAGWRPAAGAAGRGFRALCGGESLPRDLADTLLERVQELWNLYGPTETTIWSTAGRVARGSGAISIGRPIANTAVYVVDASGAPTPIGIPGEILIGGAGLAQGYHARPDLTASRFVPDRLSGTPGRRLYRTGDLGRWDPDGRLIHMGRLDRQVKLRGFRIELGEIEATLLAHPAIARAVVTAVAPGSDNGRLVAHLVYHPGQDLTTSDVRRHLRLSLPDYMVPAVFVTLDRLPLTANGKVDVRALADPLSYAADTKAAQEPPAPGLEQTIATIWQELLQIDHVGAEDNFFELGGNSLLALRVVTAIEARCGIRLPPRLLFFHSLRRVAAAARLAETERVGDR
jgi:amino acid adenylation domain-containing protein